MKEWIQAIRSVNISLLNQGKAADLEVISSKKDKKKKKSIHIEHRYLLCTS